MTLDELTRSELARTEQLSRHASNQWPGQLHGKTTEPVTVPYKLLEDTYDFLETAAAKLGIGAYPIVQIAHNRSKEADKLYAQYGSDHARTQILQRKLEATHLLAQAIARHK